MKVKNHNQSNYYHIDCGEFKLRFFNFTRIKFGSAKQTAKFKCLEIATQFSQ